MQVTKKLKYISTGIGVILLLSLYYFYDPVRTVFFPKCPFYSLTGLHCAGCGSQRALHELLHSNLLKTIDYNALYIVGVLVILYHWSVIGLEKINKKRYTNYIYHPKTPILIGVLIVLFWILRNIPIYPFTVLAP